MLVEQGYKWVEEWTKNYEASPIVNNRYDFMFFVEVVDGNPNGDPDAANLPRSDPEDGTGLISDVKAKRMVRNWVQHLVRATFKDHVPPGLRIYVQHGTALNDLHQEGYDHEKIKSTGAKQAKEDVQKVCSYMRKVFFDVRTFGGVMTTSVNGGQAKGPVQITFGRSLHPINIQEHCISRITVTRAEDMIYEELANGERKGKETDLGRKATISYGLYKFYGSVSPAEAEASGFTEMDLSLFWQALQQSFDMNRSSSSGLISTRKVIVFKHEHKLGSGERSFQLFDRVQTRLLDESKPPRKFADYEITVNKEGLPSGITVEEF